MTLVVAALLVGVQTLAVGLVALRIGRWAVPADESFALRVTAALSAAFAQVVLVGTVLGAVGLLRRWPIAIVHLLLAAAVLWRDRRRASDAADGPRAGAFHAALGGLVGAVVALYYVIGFRATTHEFDTLNYKIPNLAHMVLRHSAWTLGFTNIGTSDNLYPSNHVLLAAFLAVPFGTDAPGYLVNLAIAVLLIAAVGALAEAAGGSAISGAALGAAIALAPLALRTQAGSLQEDLAASAGIAAGAALLLAVRSARFPLRLAVLGGLALGLGAGSKYTAYLPAAAVLVVAIFLAPRVVRLNVLVVAAAGAFATTGLWIIRNAVQVDNPVSPLDVGPFKGLESPLRYYDTSLASHIVHFRTGPLHTWLSLGWRYVGLAAIVPLAGAAIALFRGRRQPVAAGLAVAAALAVLAYMATPYTGGGPLGAAFLIGSNTRYVFPGLALAAGAAGAVLPRRIALATAAASLLYSVWRLNPRDPGRPDLHLGGKWLFVVVGIACGCAVALLVHRRSFASSTSRLVLPAVALAGVTLVAGVAGTSVPRSSPTLDAALARLGAPRGPIAAVDVRDVRALLGPCLLTAPIAPKLALHGSRQPPSAAVLNSAVAALHAPALAVGQLISETRPAGWTSPPGWTKVTSDRGIDLYAPPGVTLRPPQPKEPAACAIRKVP